MLIKLSAVPSSVGFNIGLAVSFALTASACMSVVMDLVLAARSRRDMIDSWQPGHADWRAGILHGLNGVLL